MRRQMIIAAGAGVLVLVLGFMFLVRPVSTKIKETKTQTEAAVGEENNLRIQLRQLQQAQQNAPEVAARLAKFDLLLPRTSDLPTFIRQVQEAADESGIDLTSIAPSPPSPVASGAGTDPALSGKGLFSLNVVLNVQGGYFRLRAFLGRLENLQRVVQVSSLSVSPTETDEGVGTLQSTITMQMFMVNPTSPVPTQTPTASPSPSPSPSPAGGGGQGGPATPSPTPTAS